MVVALFAMDPTQSQGNKTVFTELHPYLIHGKRQPENRSSNQNVDRDTNRTENIDQRRTKLRIQPVEPTMHVALIFGLRKRLIRIRLVHPIIQRES